MSPKAMARRSRSAGSPALPTAITTRPQLASSPAMAVLTSGELAIACATRKALSSETAPSTVTVTSLLAPSPSRTTSRASSCSTSPSVSAKIAARGSSAELMASMGALPVAKTRQVSEVEVSLSTVTALNERWISGCSSSCNTCAAIGASVNTKLSIVAIAGAIMPEPLAMPAMATGTPSKSTVAVASFG